MQSINFRSFCRVAFCALIFAAIFSGLSACSSSNRLGVYKIDINQGNFLTEDVVDRLKAGQTRTQVRAILGTPLLDDAFHADRWDYVYSYRRGGREIESRKFVVYFEKDLLARWEGDKMPVSEIEKNRVAAANATGDDSDGPGFFSWLADFFSGDE